MDYNLQSKQSLKLLSKILNYELSLVLFVTIFAILFSFGPFVIIYIFIFVAIVSAPYILYVLKKVNKKGWIILFILIVVAPMLIAIIAYMLYSYLNALLFIPLLLFYFYCFLLRFSVNEWIKELRARTQYLMQKENYKLEKEIFNKRFDR